MQRRIPQPTANNTPANVITTTKQENDQKAWSYVKAGSGIALGAAGLGYNYLCFFSGSRAGAHESPLCMGTFGSILFFFTSACLTLGSLGYLALLLCCEGVDKLAEMENRKASAAVRPK